MRIWSIFLALVTLAVTAIPLAASPLGSGITYQGRLSDEGEPAEGIYDLRFTLFDAAEGGVIVAPALTLPSVPVSAGIFTEVLDFGAAVFDGQARWLEVAVRRAGEANYTPLTPRQNLTPAPYALYALTPAGPTGPQGNPGEPGALGPQGPKGDKGDPGATGPGGPQGSQGLTGPQGVAGTPGAPGARGETGAAGPQGPAGPAGPVGPKGEKGDAGATGPGGPQGPQGLTGPQGVAGTPGAPGARGETGAAGPQGPAGPAGTVGPKGDKGDEGATGPGGPQGPQGLTGPQGVAGPPGAPGSAGAVGPAGPPGSPGSKGLNWRGSWDSATSYAADDAVSFGGSSWVCTAANNDSQPGLEPGNWDLLAEKGEPGAVGQQGARGPQGVQGIQGVAGVAGPPGEPGPPGETGERGPRGPQGLPGSANAWSLTGNAGTTEVNFLGTTDRRPLDVRVDNQSAIRVQTDGRVGFGTTTVDDNAQVQINLPSSVSVPHVRIKSPLGNNGFGLEFVNPDETWFVGPNIGNWPDDRFALLPGGSLKGVIIAPNGNVALDTVSAALPFTTLTVDGSIGFTSVPTPAMFIYPSGTQNEQKPLLMHSPGFPGYGIYYRDAGDRFEFKSSPEDTSPTLVVDLDSNWVAIAATAPKPGYELSVNGQVVCEEILVQDSADWPDYVFQPGYVLKPLEEVEAHIKSHQHLPGVPAAADVEKEGIRVGDMQRRMMEKIEELTLYVIDQNKRLTAQQNQIAELQAMIRIFDKVSGGAQ